LTLAEEQSGMAIGSVQDESFKVCSYNVLATSYVRAEFYPHIPRALFDENHRIPRLVTRLVDLEADVYCLQEVEDSTFEAIESGLESLGYSAHFAKKEGSKPDGCAMAFRRRRFRMIQSIRLPFDEELGSAPSGHIAQLLIFETGRHRLGVANTHLKWDSEEKPPAQHYGYRQAFELISVIRSECYRDLPWIICGDFNAQPSSAVVQAFLDAGFEFSHTGQYYGGTCNSNAKAKMIDYIFYRSPLRAKPSPLPPIDDATPLPGSSEPSDHIPVTADFRWESRNDAT